MLEPILKLTNANNNNLKRFVNIVESMGYLTRFVELKFFNWGYNFICTENNYWKYSSEC